MGLNVSSYNPDGGVDSFVASENMTAYKAVKINSSDAGKVDLCDTAGEEPYGVVDQIWKANDNANVYRSGVVPMTAGAAVAFGARVAVDASGRAITATSAHAWSIGFARTVGAAAGDTISVLLDIVPFSTSPLNGAKVRIVQAAIGFADGTTETDTTLQFPAKCIVLGCWIDVTAAEATGGTKTIDVGTTLVSNDPDGYFDGISVAATGVIRGTLANAAVTRGALLRTDEDGAGAWVPSEDVTSGADIVSWTPGSNDFAELAAILYFEIIELA